MGPIEELASGKLILDWPTEHVARLTLTNETKRNALDHELLDALTDTIGRLDARCLLLTASGSLFSAGYDIASLENGDFEKKAESLVAHPFAAALEAIAHYAYPTIAVINGDAIGGGLELAISCDLRLSAGEARFTMPPVKIGLVYSHTGIAKFIEAIGAARTREMFLTAAGIDSSTALKWGLVNEVVGDNLSGRAVQLASDIASHSPIALRGNKRVIDLVATSITEKSPDVVEMMISLREESFRSADFREGITAFREKRRPRWK